MKLIDERLIKSLIFSSFYNLHNIIFFIGSPFCVCQAFSDDYQMFKNTVRDLDLRLSSIVVQAFDDCAGLEGMFKVSFPVVWFHFFTVSLKYIILHFIDRYWIDKLILLIDID